ncbi:hypothetical protein GCM10007938_02910 [Vibrio zhanjiangensis]|uniref:Phosphodiester glycosidase domain-containing protein n=1 Tax=Vibrio zhanjiangensis TaxID=1046128 RepID=A0ABQ6EVD6_9VIBR|nr:phosphodiester glycosidase family protein [Vibrio zhanjiangensis]GLT16515.1 hypothetical protein GCM10007938_02910 [Vibrio zhanjiangensis]
MKIQAPSSPIDSQTSSQSSTLPLKVKAITHVQAVFRGNQVRKMVSVKSIAPNIVHTKIKNTGLQTKPSVNTPFTSILNNLKPGAQYDSLLVKKGKESVDVVAIKDGESPKKPSDLIAQEGKPTRDTAYINGGFFVHRSGLKDSDGNAAPIGYTIGTTKGKNNTIPVAQPWKEDFGELRNRKGDTILTSGPVLRRESQFTGERFTYFLPSGQPSQLNEYAGALTHAGNSNERAAVTVAKEDIRLQTLTNDEGLREKGATMREWCQITNSLAKEGDQVLNLDGAASIQMGVSSGEDRKVISKGGGAGKERELANIILSSPLKNALQRS